MSIANHWDNPRPNRFVASVQKASHHHCDVRTAQGLLIRPKNKRLLDVAVATMLLPFAILVGFPFALAVWLEDRHAPFFAGPRVGKGWKSFCQLKSARWCLALSTPALMPLRPMTHALRASGTSYDG